MSNNNNMQLNELWEIIHKSIKENSNRYDKIQNMLLESNTNGVSHKMTKLLEATNGLMPQSKEIWKYIQTGASIYHTEDDVINALRPYALENGLLDVSKIPDKVWHNIISKYSKLMSKIIQEYKTKILAANKTFDEIFNGMIIDIARGLKTYNINSGNKLLTHLHNWMYSTVKNPKTYSDNTFDAENYKNIVSIDKKITSKDGDVYGDTLKDEFDDPSTDYEKSKKFKVILRTINDIYDEETENINNSDDTDKSKQRRLKEINLEKNVFLYKMEIPKDTYKYKNKTGNFVSDVNLATKFNVSLPLINKYYNKAIERIKNNSNIINTIKS